MAATEVQLRRLEQETCKVQFSNEQYNTYYNTLQHSKKPVREPAETLFLGLTSECDEWKV